MRYGRTDPESEVESKREPKAGTPAGTAPAKGKNSQSSASAVTRPETSAGGDAIVGHARDGVTHVCFTHGVYNIPLS
jgi:hypothetical protein